MAARTSLFLLVPLLLTGGCTSTEAERDTVYQVSTLAALLDGHYDGETTLVTLTPTEENGVIRVTPS